MLGSSGNVTLVLKPLTVCARKDDLDLMVILDFGCSCRCTVCSGSGY